MTDEGALNDLWPVHDATGPNGDAGDGIGRVTAGAWSPRLERNIGYAWVPIELAEPGTNIDVDSEQGPLTVSTASIPFVDPRKEAPAASLREA